MVSVRNPYTKRGAILSPEDFFGRDQEIEDIYRRILGHQSVSLVGERRIGKSSILNALSFPEYREAFGIPDEFIFINVDCQYIEGCPEDDFVDYLLMLICEQLRLVKPQPDKLALRRVSREARARGRYFVIVIDEFDRLVVNPQIPTEFFAFLRAWASEFEIPFVIASREGSLERLAETIDTGSSFLNIFGNVYIGPFKSEEAEELMRIPAENAGRPFSDEEVEIILSFAGYYPFFLQIACYLMFNLKLSGVPFEQAKEQVRRNFAYEATPHFEYLLQRVTENERAALRLWIQNARAVDHQGYEGLLRKGILIEGSAGTRLFSEIFSEMVRTQEGTRQGVVRTVRNTLLK